MTSSPSGRRAPRERPDRPSAEPTAAPASADPLDEGDPRTDPRAYRRVLGQFATGVSVVTASAGEGDALVTVNSFASVSLDPPLVLWSLRGASTSLPIFRASEHFAVNVLASDQVEVADRYARSAGGGRRLAGTHRGLGGAPLLPGIAASFECRRTVEHEGGDHVVFFGEVVRYRRFDRTGLLFAQGRYALAVDHPVAATVADMPVVAAGEGPDRLAPLLLRAYAALADASDAEREALGLDRDQGRIAAWLAAHPGGTPARIAREAMLGRQAADDAVAALVERGLAVRSASGTIATTERGRSVADALARRAAALQAERLARFDAPTLAAVREVLAVLAGDG